MTNDSELMRKVKRIIEERGKDAIERASEEILKFPYNSGILYAALAYFAKVTLHGALPTFSALVSLSCEAAGGKTEKTVSISAALTLIAAAADIHDDIIDQSTTKYSKKTVFGKFGSDIALLAGDVLLMQGSMLLHRECESLSKEQGKAIPSLISEALFEISNAEAKETCLRRKLDTTPQEYFEVIRLKAVVPEMHCKIGGILGNANEKTIKSLGHYGRTFGMVATIREEFIDLLEYPDLQNRIKNECPPFPLLCALQNSEIRSELMPLIKSSNLSKRDANKIVKIVLGSKEVQELEKNTGSMIKKEIKRLSFIQESSIGQEAAQLLRALA